MSATGVLKGILIFGIVSTAIHFPHNIIEIESYPSDPFSPKLIQIAGIVSWPIFTAIGILGYRAYRQGRLHLAHPLLAAYGFFAMISVGHFANGTPDVAPFWLATVFTDILAGAAMLAFVGWSVRATRSTPAASG